MDLKNNIHRSLQVVNTKDCNCFITLNENESETKSIRLLIKQYQI